MNKKILPPQNFRTFEKFHQYFRYLWGLSAGIALYCPLFMLISWKQVSCGRLVNEEAPWGLDQGHDLFSQVEISQ